jgi:asparagine synthase (glutamine-hydrolysing)
MAGVACAVSLGESTIDLAAVRKRMIGAASHRGDFVDHVGPWGFLGAYRWPDEAGVLCVEQQLACAAHGHLFGVPVTQTSTSIVRAYQAGGWAALSELDGEISFVLLDLSCRTLYLCRDTFGSRPLFAWRDRDTVLVASEVSQILASGLVPRRPSREKVRETLGLGRAPRELTVFEGIRRILPAQVRTCSPAGGDAARRTWHPVSKVDWSIPYEEAARQFPQVLRRSVERRHWVRPVLTLSGGLDSTSIAAIVSSDPALRERFSMAGKVTAATLSFPGFDCDETASARSVARRLGLDHLTIDATLSGPIRAAPQLQSLYDQPVPGSSGYQVLVDLPEYRSRGFSTCCLGIGGDDFWMGERCWPFDSIVRGRISKESGGPGLAPGLWWDGMRSAFLGDDGLRALAGRIRSRLRRRSGSASATRDASERFDTLSWARAFELTDRIYSHSVLEFIETVCSHWQVTPRYPFLDRTMADFAYRLPPAFVRRGGVFKGLVRDAMRSLLPDEVLANKVKLTFASVIDEEIRLRTEELLGEKGSWAIWDWLRKNRICDQTEIIRLRERCWLTSWRDWALISVVRMGRPAPIASS